jgi:anaerobic carbon-monoxide dehydrogenase iron sulfur subunit
MERKVLVVDLNLCSGCRSCELRCAFKHHQTCDPTKSRMRVVRMDHVGVSVPLFCFNCEEGFCQEICPTQAIHRNEKTGALVLREEKCVRCRACTMVCPFSGLQVLPDRSVVKCDLCGGDPYCVKYCETGALKHVDAEDVGIQKAYLLAEKFVRPYLKR